MRSFRVTNPRDRGQPQYWMGSTLLSWSQTIWPWTCFNSSSGGTVTLEIIFEPRSHPGNTCIYFLYISVIQNSVCKSTLFKTVHFDHFIQNKSSYSKSTVYLFRNSSFLFIQKSLVYFIQSSWHHFIQNTFTNVY